MEELIKMNGESKNELKDKINELSELFPEVMTEGMIDFDKLRLVLGEQIDENQERYSFQWHGKREALRLSQKTSLGTLRPKVDESVNWDTTSNLFIEGDNLEVLKLLQKSYHGQIKVVYMDPPYNTTNDFVYNDSFNDSIQNYLYLTKQVNDEGSKVSTKNESQGRYHTKWLNMIYPRLRLARNLLSKDGFIFISIDHREVFNLKKVMDEVYGENNFVACVANVNNPKGRSDDKYFATAHEYLVIYKKNDGSLYGFDPEEKVLKRYNKVDQNGNKYREIDLRKTGDNDRREDRPNMFYYFYFDNKENHFFASFEKLDKEDYIEIFPTRTDGSHGRWRWGYETCLEKLDKLEPKYMAVREKWTVIEKDYLTADKQVTPTTVWDFKDVNSERGTEQFVDLGFDKEVFERPKPLGTLKRILKIATREDDIVLDLFAGSGGMAQAVLEKNIEDKYNRRFIMVQLPEVTKESSKAFQNGFENICEIGKERIRRTLVKYEDDLNLNNLDSGFKVFKLDTSNIKEWHPNYDTLEITLDSISQNFILNRTEEDVLYELMLKFGLDLSYPVQKYEIESSYLFEIGFGALFVCLSDNISMDVANYIIHKKDDLNPEVTRVVFKDNGFKSDSEKINIIQTLKLNGISEVMSV